MPYDLVSPQRKENPGGLEQRDPPPRFRDLVESADRYQASAALCEALNVALTLHAPLLITGEPGTGKTQVAWFARRYFGLPREAVFPLYVKSTTDAEELTSRFDTVAYFQAANDRERSGPLERSDYVIEGRLVEAWRHGGPTIVLIDEIDKAPRDFPNDLLHTLDQNELELVETGEVVRAPKDPPLVVITSNSERRLPEPFLRRCVFHHIELTPELVRQIIEAHKDAYPSLSRGTRDAAQARFSELREENVRKKPSAGELLAWLAVLHAMDFDDGAALRAKARGDLPALGVLVKDSDDLETLRGA